MSEELNPKNMNIFEDLIDELRDANLIEEPVIETQRARDNSAPSAGERRAVEAGSPDETVRGESVESAAFYRQQATAEVAFLQTVESIFAGVERDQLNLVPNSYDDLEVKKILHSLLQTAPDASAYEHSQAEFKLLQATESWFSTLVKRDKRIMTAHLRRYCESSNPPLSLPALIALARFYRNSPYSEHIRSKFDLLLTRIFSHEEPNSKRELGFSRDELAQFIRELYAEWSSVPLYATEADDAGILQVVAQFENFAAEARAAESFDELLNSYFFNRLRQFKESTCEDFYAPPVAAVAVEINVLVGNLYVELLGREKRSSGVEKIEAKYGLTNDDAVSEATGKTLTLIELLKQKYVPRAPQKTEPAAIVAAPPAAPAAAPPVEEPAAVAGKKNSNKWIWAALAAVLLIAVVYFAAGSSTATDESAATPLNLENSQLKNYLQEARIEDDTLKATVLPSWGNMNAAQRREALQTMQSFGGEKGYRKIELFNGQSEKVGIVTNGEIYVVE